MSEQTSLTYENIEEALKAVEWLTKTRPYLFVQNNPNFYPFQDYLNLLKIAFKNKCMQNGKEVDAYLSPEENFEILYVHKKKWKQRKPLSNTALMVHELSEGYMLNAEHVFFSNASHVIAAFFEFDFGQQYGLPKCSICKLPMELIPSLRDFESELEKRIHSIEHFEVEKLLQSYSDIKQYTYKGF